MGDKTDHGGASQDPGVTQGGDGRDRDAFGHHRLFADRGVQHRHDVRAPGADQRIAQQCGFPGRGQGGQQQARGGGEAPKNDHALGPQPAHDGVAGQAPDGHGQGEGGVAQAGIRGVEVAFVGQKHRAPVQHRAFGEKHDKAQAADKQHHPMGNGKGRAGALAAIGQHVRCGLEQGNQQQHDHHQGRAQRRQTQAQ